MAAPLSKSKSQLSASSARLRSSSSQKVFPSASMDLDGCEPATTISPQAREACVAVHFPANTPQESRDVLLPLEEPTRSLSAGQHPLPPPRTGHMQRQLSESSGLAAIASRSGAASPVVASDAASRVGIPVTGSGRSSRGRVSSDGAKGMSQAAEPSFAIEMSAAKGGFRNSAAEPKAIKKPHEASAIPMSPSLSSFKSRSQTNLYQQISFSYMNDLIKQGSRREILVEEYPPVENDDDAGDASHRILTAWRQEHAQRGSAASLWRVLRKVYGWQYTGIGLLFLFETFVKIAESFLLGLLLDWFDSGTDASEGYARAAALSSAVIIHALINQYKFFLGTRLGMQIRVGLTAAIYQKCLSLPLAQVSSSGQIINMISNELQRIEDAAGFAFYIVIGPIEALLVFYFVYEQIGLAAVAAVGALLMLVPLQSVFANQFAVLRRATNVHRDNRTKSITDMIAGMLVVKLYAWELPFIGRIKDLRDKELASIRKASVLRALNEAIFFASSSIVSMFAFVSFYFLGGVLTASNVFTCLTYLQTVRQTMTNLFSKGLQFSSEAMVSLQRVQQFLLRPEFEKRSSGPADMVNLKEFNHPSTAIAIKDGSFSWKPGTKAKQERAVEIQCSDAKAQAVKMPPLPPRAEPDLVLRNIDLCVRFGELLGVCGPVGSGKTSLINAILGEIECVSGFVAVRSQSIAYVSQSAWILPGTIKDNILFGRAYREEWFWEVVRACALEADIERLSMREHTFLGERGFTVSGGQRARIALARAVYADAEVYLLDDPLSAVDPHVGRHIFEQCIRGVLKRKAVILVTHLLQYVERCNEVLLLESGAMVQSGKFGRVASVEGSAFAAVMREYSVPEGLDAIAAKANSTAAAAKMQKEQSRRVVKTSVMGLGGATTSMPGGNSAHVDESPGASPFNSGNSTMGTAIGKKVLLDSSQTQPPRKNAFDETDDSDDDLSEADIEALRISLAKRKSIVKSQTPTEPKPEANDLAAEAAKANKTYNTEDVKRGSVSSRIYIDYLAAGAPALSIVCLVALLFAGEMLLLATDWWLSRWATMSAGTQQNPQNLYVFAALAFSTLLVSILRAVWFFSICIAASKELFSKMLSNVFAAPMSFFQANPQGRLINRFSKDVSLLDEMLPQTFFDVTQRSLMILGTLAIATWIIPYVALAIPAIGIAFVLLRKSYMRASRQMKRLEATTRSPVLSTLSLSLEGLALIRSFGAQQRFVRDFVGLQNDNTRVYFAFMSSGRWLGLRLDFLASNFLTVVAMGSIAIQHPLGLSSTSVGLLLSYVLQLVGLLQWSVRQSAEVENLMVSTERVMEYGRLAHEETQHARDNALKPSKEWPQHGRVNIRGMWLQYPGAERHVLKNISVALPAGAKVGIVGRTGAGKSSFIQALFRLFEPSPPGSIEIDGIKTSDVSLLDLRSRLAIIPQEPVCFKGTLRFNLDPRGEHSDDDIWRVLDVVELKDRVMEMAKRLDSEVAENGGNLSVGERQLICLARAVLRGSRIVVMDEATSSVDVRTDRLVQSIVGAQTGDHASFSQLARQMDDSGSCADVTALGELSFKTATVITIAHRLHTIIDYDVILVLENGLLVEHGPPWTLLEKDAAEKTAFFARMVAQLGPESQQHLVRLANMHKRLTRAISRRATAASNKDRASLQHAIASAGGTMPRG